MPQFFSRFIYIYVVLLSQMSFAQLAAPVVPVRVLPMPIGATTTLAQQPLVMQSGYCPPGYLPQYCGLNTIGTPCTAATPVYQCIQQARIMGAYASNGCALGDQNCMMQQQMTGCPPGLLGGNCRQYYWQQQMYYQQQLQRQQFVQGAVMGGMLGSALMQQLMRGFGGGGGGPGGSGGMGPSSARGGAAYSQGGGNYSPAGSGEVGSGKLDACGTPPGSVTTALKEAVEFRRGCRLAQQGGDKKIAINDYSGSMPAYMWIFSSDGKRCLGKTSVSYGNGVNRKPGQERQCTDGSGRPLPCSEDGCHTTPPGFHLTAPHDCDKCQYSGNNSLLMVGLEGQESAQRGILIHVAESSGGASSWGCSGVGCFQDVKQMLGSGSLVYNYFGSVSLAPTCGTQAGMSNQRDPRSCRPDVRVSGPSEAAPPAEDSSATPD